MQTNNAHEYTDAQLQAAIDAAFPVVNRPYDPHLGTEKDAPLWGDEALSRLAIARAFLAALPQAEADPYARLKAYAKAGARIRYGFGGWHIHFDWLWNGPVEDYEVHPGDLHMVPEYALAKPTESPQSWTLPAPPAGFRWHREDFTPDMLPEGWRPLLDGEVIEAGDEFFATLSDPSEWKSYPLSDEDDDGSNESIGRPCEGEFFQHRTRRPLPAPSAELPKVVYRNRNADWSVAYEEELLAASAEPPQAQPATFTAHGKVWTRHTPGDPCPCDPEAVIYTLWKYEITSETPSDVCDKASKWEWGKRHRSRDEIIGWRYADEPAQAPAEPISHPILTLAQDQIDATPEMQAAAEAVLKEEAFPAAPAEAAEAQQDRIRMTVNEGLNKRCHELHDMLSQAEAKLAELQASQPPAQPTQPPQDWTPRPGDVVRLKSGGPDMTVESVTDFGIAFCSWMTATGSLETRPVAVVMLQPAKEEARP